MDHDKRDRSYSSWLVWGFKPDFQRPLLEVVEDAYKAGWKSGWEAREEQMKSHKPVKWKWVK